VDATGPHAFDARAFAPFADAIAGLAPRIRAQADRAEQQRHIDIDLAQAIAAAGLHRLTAPRDVGGHEAHPFMQILAIEALSRIDGSTGWNLMIGLETLGILSATLPESQARDMLGDPTLIISGALNPLGRARRVDGGFLVSGQWPMASGCHASSHFWGQCVVATDDPPEARPPVQLIEVLVPRAQFEILDTWHVSGLRSSGSHDVKVTDVFVPDMRVTRIARGPRATGPLYRLPQMSRLAYNKVGVATGIARAAIDHFMDLALTKTPRGSSSKLAGRADAHQAIAEAEVLLQSSRAFVFQAVGELWRVVCDGGQPDTRLRALLQLACSHAAQAAVDAVDKVHAATGISANFLTSPLERCTRDVRVVRQHIMTSGQWIQGAGRVLLGEPSGSFVL
jgi:alkylation response protein AidB-like acyl-CoA dehydrogenase